MPDILVVTLRRQTQVPSYTDLGDGDTLQAYLKPVETDPPSNPGTVPVLSAQLFKVLTHSDNHRLIQWLQKTSGMG